MQQGWIQTLQVRPRIHEVFNKLIEHFVQSDSADPTTATDSSVLLLAEHLKNAKAHLTRNPAVVMALLTAMIVNSGISKYVTFFEKDIIFFTSSSPNVPSHWPALSDTSREARLFVFRVLPETVNDISANYKIPKNIREKLIEQILETKLEMRQSVSETLSKAYVVVVHDLIHDDTVSKNPFCIKSFTCNLAESEKLVSRVKMKTIHLNPTHYTDIVKLQRFSVVIPDPVQVVSEYTHNYASKQIYLASEFSFGPFKFNSPKLFPWFLIGSLWNYNSVLAIRSVFSWSQNHMLLDSLVVTKKATINLDGNLYFTFFIISWIMNFISTVVFYRLDHSYSLLFSFKRIQPFLYSGRRTLGTVHCLSCTNTTRRKQMKFKSLQEALY